MEAKDIVLTAMRVLHDKSRSLHHTIQQKDIKSQLDAAQPQAFTDSDDRY